MGGPVIVYDFTGGSDDTHTWVEWPNDHGSELAHSFGSPLGHNWPKPITIRARNPEDPILPLSDCPHHTSSDVIVLSRRAVDALHDLLSTRGRDPSPALGSRRVLRHQRAAEDRLPPPRTL